MGPMPFVYAGRVAAATDLVEQGCGGASVGRVVAVFWGEVVAYEALQCGPARRQCLDRRVLSRQLVGYNGGDQVVLGGEVRVERAVGQPGI